MKLRVLLMVVFVSIAALLTSCGEEPVYIGKYVNGDMYIELQKNGNFEVKNLFSFTGKYTIDGDDLMMNISKMNGKSVTNNVKGKLEGDTIIGPDGISYKKQ